ncbi:MAG: phospholipase D-like domain-containing protein [Sphingomonadaceae bacterium]
MVNPDDAAADKNISRLSPGVGPDVWRYAHAEKASVIVDAADYFAHMQDAMLRAERRIFLIGWDFDTRIHLLRGRRWWQRPFSRDFPSRLGNFIDWLARHRKRLDIRILKWSVGVIQLIIRSSMWLDVIRWMWHPRITFKFDKAHPIACSQHQKLAVLDNRLAVCGGIDMTDGRWDTRAHAEEDPRRKNARGKPFDPWHDASMMMEGEVADVLAEIGEDRWIRAGGKPMPSIEPASISLWPEALEPQFENVEIGIARTRATYRNWDEVREIEALFVSHFRRAKHFIYAESQYFASRTIAEAIIERAQDDDPPEIVIVHPEHADGWLEQQAMDHARASLTACIEAIDSDDRFSLWVPMTGRKSIYVHAKLMIVDDEVLHIGSANFNNRSMGLDSECDVFIDSARERNAHCGPAIQRLRYSLLAEHLDLEEEEVPALLEKYGSMRALIESRIEKSGRYLKRYVPPELTDVERTLAESEFLDPESPDDMFEPFAKGGLFRKGSPLSRIRARMTKLRQKVRR